jgi:hypothetical protein
MTVDVFAFLGYVHLVRCRGRVFVFKRVVTYDNLDSIKFPLSKNNFNLDELI